MAVKKTTKKKDESAAPTKAEAKETAPKKAPKAKAPVEAVPEPAKKAAPKKAAAAPIKLSASQDELLKKIGETADTGYMVAKKVEERSIESLLTKKLIKKGAKDKASGALRYHISSSGKKHLTTS
ncbi:hypothetical protein P12x_000858 [Tundrisphaera lichenicola]|uniref:hypothetical protein n=1 Tax=Tundrisphaera lichenicola TaxID=2029860 RepID=UPI003EC00C8B